MLVTVNRQLRRHRRRVWWAIALFAVALAGLTTHSALMSSGMGDHAMSEAPAVCLVVGGSLAVAGAAACAVRRLLQRPLWPVTAPLAPALVVVPSSTGPLVRAGPSPSLLQVFRL